MKSILNTKATSVFILFYLLCALVLFWIIKEDWSVTSLSKVTVKPDFLIEETNNNGTVEQTFHVDVDTVQKISIQPYIWDYDEQAQVRFTLSSQSGNTSVTVIPVSEMTSSERLQIFFEPAVEGKTSDEWKLRAEVIGNARLSFYAGDSVSTGRFDVKVQNTGELNVNGNVHAGSLAMEISGTRDLNGTRFYWPVALGLLLLCLFFLLYENFRMVKGKSCVVLYIIMVYNRYRYLIKMLVRRDFRVKYKASVLGVFWSFLNPLLMTGVYSFVFSNLFRSNIDNFVVYLMSGIILFNYFSEATNLGMMSIVGNASLITKVYVPKYIYPLSRVLSSSINLLISFIPLFIIMAFTGVPFRKSLLLLPFVVVCLIALSTGMSLILSALHVFFRDTQFLWSILLTVWNFLTPIFYPESIIPAAYVKIYHINPMYQMCYFVRTVILNGISPTPVTYFYCLLVSFVPLCAGLWFFHKSQDKFALYL